MVLRWSTTLITCEENWHNQPGHNRNKQQLHTHDLTGTSAGLVTGTSAGLVTGTSAGLVTGTSAGLVTGISAGLEVLVW